MSFFGFDPSIPPHLQQGSGAAGASESYDFQDTYDGLGEDAFNDETFGDSHQEPWTDPSAQAAAPAPKQNVSYAQAASSTNNDDEFMNDLWGTAGGKEGAGAEAQQQQQQQQQAPQEKKFLSLEEIEAQLTAIDQLQQQHQQQQVLPHPQYGYPGMMPPQFAYGMMPPAGFMPAPGQYGQMMGGPMPMQQMQPMGYQPQLQQQPQQQQQQPIQQLPIQQQQQQAPVQQQHQPIVQEAQQAHPQQGAPQNIPARRPSKVDTAQFPVLGAKGNQQQFQGAGTAESAPLTGSSNSGSNSGSNNTGSSAQTSYTSPQQRNHNNQNFHELTPEQQAKLARRQEKVARIMKYSGIMNPRDKDYVTRFQLSQIVTEDPYNEDFYAQVFKVIHPKANSTHLQEHSQQHNSIAQAYLEQSGHRLGGRFKRADVALQRMQQQVQKAVTVAKERPKLTQYAREGALGKISFGNGKKPRQQLEIFSQAAQREIEKQEQLEKEAAAEAQRSEGEAADVAVSKTVASTSETDEEKSDFTKESTPVSNSRRPLSISAPSPSTSSTSKSYSRKDVMCILENIITKVMNLESSSRLNPHDVDTSELWDSLHILDQPSTSSSATLERDVNPFIQCLNHNKALRILPRLFKFLTREQILTIVTLIMSNLENLYVIKKGSYTTYQDKIVPLPILKLIETYTLTFSKVLMNSVQDFKFNEIIGLLVILIEHNNVSFVSTTKIGLSILTTLLSRAELIKGEGVNISATDLSEWSSCYDELFTSLESRISSIFPPHPQDIDDGSSRENYVWQFLATLSLGGKLSHQRIIVDEVRDEIFGVMSRAKAIDNSDVTNLYKKQNLLNNLNMYLVVMGLVADESEIKELQS